MTSSDLSATPLAELESIALAFYEKVHERDLIKDRKHNLRTYPNVLVGQDAVTVLVDVLKTLGHGEVSREVAATLGRDMNAHFNLLAHVVDEKKHALKDEYLFYRFKNNLPIQVQEARKGKTSWDIMDVFEDGVDVQDRIYHLRTYRQCFIGSDAVDVVLKMQLAVNREDAVDLMRAANMECVAFEHVHRHHDFQDAYLFFHFLPRKLRPLNPNNGGHTFAAMLDAMNPVEESSHGSSFDEDSLKEDHASREHLRQRSESFSTWSSQSRESVSIMMDYSTALGLLPPNTTLHDIATTLERELPIKNHRYRFTVYKDCFIASEAVTYMVKAGIAPSRRRAELIGRHLQWHLNLWEHVTGAHKFRDKYYFFRFNPPSLRKLEPILPLPWSTPDKTLPSGSISSLPKPPSRGLGSRIPSSKMSIGIDFQESQTSLEEIAAAFEQEMKVQDRVFLLRTYKNAFTGMQAVNFMLKKGFCETRQDAVLLGRLMMEDFLLFKHIGNSEIELWDCPTTLYQFTSADERAARSQLKQRRKETMERVKTENNERFSIIEPSLDEANMGLGQNKDIELLKIAALFRHGVTIKHNRYRGKVYQDTFIGSQAVDFLVNSSLASNRREAVNLGRRLMHELHLFDHVAGKRDFSDDFLFYRLEEHQTQSHRHDKPSIGSSVAQVVRDSLSSWSNLEDGKKSFRDEPNVTPSEAGDFSGGADFLPLEKIAQAFRRNVETRERRYGFSTYHDVFVGCDAVDYLLSNASWASSRIEAVQIGRTLMRELDLFRHVTESQSFQDRDYFYRFTDEDEECMLLRLKSMFSNASMPLLDDQSTIEPKRLVQVARSLEENLKPKTHKYRLLVYRNTLLGSDIVSLLVDEGLATTRGEALRLGCAVARHFRLFEHVTMDHALKDANLFYRFVPRENRANGKWFDDRFGEALRDKMVNASRKRTALSTKEYWDLVIEAVEQNVWLVRSSTKQEAMRNYIIDSDDTEWNRRVRSFEVSFTAKMTDSMHGSILAHRSASTSTDRVKCWSATFIRLDPRQQIHRFYNEVAQTGLTLVEEDGGSRPSVRAVTLKDLRPLFRFLPINLAKVFSVWRPTSYDAIRKMMVGDAVGKGLDIKGKSARRGKLSGYVPFLQISENKHKTKVRRLSPNHMVRVFYRANARRARDIVMAELEKTLMEMLEMVKEAKKILATPDSADKEMHANALEVMLLDVTNPVITPIDDYAPDCYGIEMPERLLWQAYFVNQDCTRPAGSIYDTGRPSQPAYQDMNFTALRSKPHEGGPTPVIFQNSDRDDPMNPFEMLMAYEENGRVRPVVSDFDCFLVGTRRVEYSEPLPLEQLEVLKWCVRQIEGVVQRQLEESKKGITKGIKPWSVIWLEVLKESSFHPEVPRFGFGDPVSYSIVENAVDRLNLSGAVRHGAECFNYYFPQDLDDQFLVVCEGIGERNVPWKYVGVDELLDILATKIEEGFCFPLNPKWILMDPGWMQLYQSFLISPCKHVQDAMNIWFPPETGLREDIERIYRLQRENRKLCKHNSIVYEELSHSIQEEILYFT